MEKTELKPCPFCGGEVTSYSIPSREYFLMDRVPYRRSGFVECLDCECSLAAKTEEDAIIKWNKRAYERHASWLPFTVQKGIFTGCTFYRCSFCGREEEDNGELYCHCGAKMDGDDRK